MNKWRPNPVPEENRIIAFFKWFWSGYLGQRLLLLITPLLIVHPFRGNSKPIKIMEKMHLGMWGPIVGWTFMASAVFACIQFLDSHSIHLSWLLPLESWTAKARFYFLGLIVSYAIPFSWFGGARMLKLFPEVTLASMGTYYGGIYMMWGVVMWSIVLWGGLSLSWFPALLTLGILVALAAFGYIELKRRQTDSLTDLGLKDRRRLRLVQSSFFISTVALGILGISLF